MQASLVLREILREPESTIRLSFGLLG